MKIVNKNDNIDDACHRIFIKCKNNFYIYLRFLLLIRLYVMRTMRTLSSCMSFPARKKSLIQILIFNVLFLLCSAFSFYANAAEDNESYIFDIPALKVEEALGQLAVQTGRQLLFSYELVDSLNSYNVFGEYTVKSALDVLLKDTGLFGSLTERGVILITPMSAQNKAQKGKENMNKNKLSIGVAAAFAAVFGVSSGIAQEDSDNKRGSTNFLDEIVVTGSARAGQTALETSYGVAVLGSDAISRDAPNGLTALADAIPGLQGEFSNGETNSNLNVRGTQGGFISFISLQEDGLPVQYSPFFAEFELRNDLTFERVEAVLGGPSGIFTAQGAAATINYISRRPTETEGEVRFSATDYGQVRTDLFYGGPINDNGWYGSIGGFYRQGDGIRDTGYTASNGGQIRASLTKKFGEGSSLTLAYKKIDDQSPYYNPLPADTSDPGSPRALAGFDPSTDALAGPDVRIINSRRPGGEIVSRDLSDGNVSKTDQFTISFDHDFGNGWSMSEKARFSSIQTIAHDFRGGSDAGLMEAEDFVAAQLDTLQEAFPDTESVQLVRVNDGQVIADPSALNGNGLLAVHGLNEYDRRTDNFINDLRFNWENDSVLVTVGLQSWRVNTETSNPQDQFLIDIRSNANRFDVGGLDAAGNVVAHLTDSGVITHGSLDNHGGLETDSNNLYVNLEFSLTDNIRIDVGARHEEGEVTGFGEDVSVGVAIAGTQDNNILADNTRLYTRNGNIFTGQKDYDTDSFTIGGNWAVSDNLAFYARYASAEDMNFANEFSFYNIPSFGTPAGSNLRLSDVPAELTFSEIGVRYLGDRVSGYLTYFDTEHENAGSIVASDTGAAEVLTADTLASGIEFWLDFELFDNFQVNLSGVVMDAERQSASGSLPINRVPETQIRLAPIWYLGNLELFAGIQYYSDRNHDDTTAASAVSLPSYTQIDLGASYEVSEQLSIMLQAKNLSDELGFTSANFRVIVPDSAVRYNSTIPGRNWTLSANYSF